MDAPFSVWGDVVQQLALRLRLGAVGFIQHGGVGARLVGRKHLAPLEINFVFQVEMLAPGECAPGDQALYVQSVWRIGAPVIHQARPGGGSQHAVWLGDNVVKCVAYPARAFCQVHQGDACLMFLGLKGAPRQLTIRCRIQQQNSVSDLPGIFQGGQHFPCQVVWLALCQCLVFIGNRNAQPVHAHPFFFQAGSQADHLIVQGGVIAPHYFELRHALARNRFYLPGLPIPHFWLG